MAAPSPDYRPRPIHSAVRQSPPVDLSKPYDIATIKNKHILITGGASGFGAEWAHLWAQAGATLVLADINTKLGTEVVAKLRWRLATKRSGADVQGGHMTESTWRDRLCSPTLGSGTEPFHDPFNDFAVDEPPKPDLRVLDVNLTGVVYTTQLVLWWLKRNPGSSPASVNADSLSSPRDRHLLLVSSIAGLGPILSQPLYGASKHAVLGLFRSLRGSAFLEGVRTNIIFPYFIETPINPASGRALVAGGNMGNLEDVVEAASRLVADSSILGRGLCIAPRARVRQEESGDWVVLPYTDDGGKEKGIWEVNAHDFDDTEMFTRRLIVLLNLIAGMKGWFEFFFDLYRAARYKIVG